MKHVILNMVCITFHKKNKKPKIWTFRVFKKPMLYGLAYLFRWHKLTYKIQLNHICL